MTVLPIATRYALWTASNDTGASALVLGCVMMGAPLSIVRTDYPRDPSDLGRCLRLMERIPEWKNNLSDIAPLSPKWDILVQHWDELRLLMLGECGIDWSIAKSAPRTKARMDALLK